MGRMLTPRRWGPPQPPPRRSASPFAVGPLRWSRRPAHLDDEPGDLLDQFRGTGEHASDRLLGLRPVPDVDPLLREPVRGRNGQGVALPGDRLATAEAGLERGPGDEPLQLGERGVPDERRGVVRAGRSMRWIYTFFVWVFSDWFLCMRRQPGHLQIGRRCAPGCARLAVLVRSTVHLR